MWKKDLQGNVWAGLERKSLLYCDKASKMGKTINNIHEEHNEQYFSKTVL